MTYLDKELVPGYGCGRDAVCDILCRTDNNEYILIEMQRGYQKFFIDRGLLYLARLLDRQAQRGKKWDFRVDGVIGIFLMTFHHHGKGGDAVLTDIMLYDRYTKKVASDKIRMLLIDFSSFKKQEEECKSRLDRWLYILKNMEKLNHIPFMEHNRALLERYEEIARVHGMTEAEYDAYRNTLDLYRTELATLEAAVEEGMEKGMEKGLKKGLLTERLRNARRMLAEGLSCELIARVTGMSVEEVMKLTPAS